ncbi:MAG: SUMF1/EgtB/PvdO family nonheme iron enzyme, partial [Thiotrichales bacterium]|nr:SUMF1/EgtB/PvdO family nonheme iron enzyme [Thiotrichales bacterium]
MPRQDNTTVVVVNVKESEAAAGEIEEIERTAEHPVTGIPDEPSPRPAAPPPAYEAPAEDKKSPVGMIAGIVVVLVVIAGGGYFMLAGGDKPAATPPDMEVATPEPEATDSAAPEEETVAAEPEPEVTAETPPEETVPAETPPASTASEAEPEPAAAAAGNEFQDTLKSGGEGPMMVKIPAGSFSMGSSGSSRFSEERPRHKVTLEAFAMSKFEITFEQYERFAKAKGRKLPDNLYLDKQTHPVLYVSWDDAFYYAKWLSEETGHKYSLASEAQWEYAASTGKKSPYWWGYEEEPGRAHCTGCGSGFDPKKPTKTGSFPPNGFGLHDTAGNVAEWVQDCWHENYKEAPDDGSVWEGGDCSFRAVRGGSYAQPISSLRSQKRDKFKSDKKYDTIGIRVVRKLD